MPRIDTPNHSIPTAAPRSAEVVNRSAESIRPVISTRNNSSLLNEPRVTNLGQEISFTRINEFLHSVGADYTLTNHSFVKSEPDSLEAMEGQPRIDRKDVSAIHEAVLAADYSDEKMAVMQRLMPLLQKEMNELAKQTPESAILKDKVVGLLKAYANTMGGRDLAIDDMIATANSYLFDQVGNDGKGLNALNKGNIASAVATSLLMLAPTIGKNVPLISEALKDGNYKDAVLPALSILAISSMTANPIFASAGLDKLSAIAGATGNALMMANLPHILHHAFEWVETYQDNPNPSTKPFSAFARSNALVDGGTHTTLDFLHEFAAQLGFFVLNIQNAIGGGAERNPAVFPLLGVLISSAVIHMGKGEKPFDDFESDAPGLASDLAQSNGSATSQAGSIALQSKIHQYFDVQEFKSILDKLPQPSVGQDLLTQIGVAKLSNVQEKEFSKELLVKLFPDVDDSSLKEAVNSIFNFQSHGVEEIGCDSALKNILDYMQEARGKDRSYFGDSRGVIASNNYYDNFIAEVIKCCVYEELMSDQTPQDRNSFNSERARDRFMTSSSTFGTQVNNWRASQNMA